MKLRMGVPSLLLAQMLWLGLVLPSARGREGTGARSDAFALTGVQRGSERTVNDFRQRTDPDYTLAFKRAMEYAAQHPGTRLTLLCDSDGNVGSFFTITSGFWIPSHTTLEASSRSACFIDFIPAPKSPADSFIVSLKGSDSVTLRNLTVNSYSDSPPKVGVLLERGKDNGAAGHHVIENVTVEGRFSIAPVYSISSEENLWISDSFLAQGGGAKAAFYTAGEDHLAVCRGADCQTGMSSNLSLWMFAGHVVNSQPDGNGIVDVLDATGVGDHSFFSTYVGLNSKQPGTASGFVFEGPQIGQGTNSSVQVLSSRIENGAYMVRFVNGTQTTSGTMSRFVFRDNTYGSEHARKLFFAAEGVAIQDSRFSNNDASGTPGNSSEFGTVLRTSFDEDHQAIVIRTLAQGNRFVGSASISIPEQAETVNYLTLTAQSGNAGQPACSPANRGQFRFTNGSHGAADRLSVCRRAAGGIYGWAPIF